MINISIVFLHCTEHVGRVTFRMDRIPVTFPKCKKKPIYLRLFSRRAESERFKDFFVNRVTLCGISQYQISFSLFGGIHSH